ncbi:MAG: apolipoprotein N-acyltransferase, partial [Bdellovibrio sp.]
MFKPHFLILLSGIFLGTSYVPFPPWALGFFWVPLLYALMQATSIRQAFFYTWLAMLGMLGLSFYWIAYVAHEFGFFPWPVAGLILFLFVALVYFYIPLAGAFFWYLHHRLRWPLGISLLGFLLTISVSEAFWPGIFPWNLGYPLYWARLSLAQWADVFGFWGLSLLVHANSLIIFWALRSPLVWPRKFLAIGLWVILFLGLQLSGKSHLEQLTPPNAELRVLQVQGNISSLDRLQGELNKGSNEEIARKFFQMTETALQQEKAAGRRVDLVVWPESAYPDFLNHEVGYRPMGLRLRDFVRRQQTPLITGGYAALPSATHFDEYNGLFLFDSQGNLRGKPYHKTKLLVFGEYTPLSRIFPFLARISPAGTGFTRGTGPEVLEFEEKKWGPQICYESLDANFSAESALLGSQILINLTNDSWFGPTSEPY